VLAIVTPVAHWNMQRVKANNGTTFIQGYPDQIVLDITIQFRKLKVEAWSRWIIAE
jgi:hypothetical protein